MKVNTQSSPHLLLHHDCSSARARHNGAGGLLLFAFDFKKMPFQTLGTLNGIISSSIRRRPTPGPDGSPVPVNTQKCMEHLTKDVDVNEMLKDLLITCQWEL